jgi:hypothetical protein
LVILKYNVILVFIRRYAMMDRVRPPRESGLRVFVARNLGALTCGECGRVLLKSEVEGQWRFHWNPPLCFECMPRPAVDPEIAVEREKELLH